MSLRRGSAKLKTLGRSHAPLHMLLWQAREAQSTLLAAASAQKTLFSDIAAWASTENRALNDVCSCASELSTLYSGALSHLAYAFKTFRKEVSLVLEGEKRCDLAQKRLQDAEQKRIKLRRQVLRAQNKTINEGQRQAGDFTQLQTQLAEAERTAERAHVESCDAAREQEAVKLVVMRNSLTKLSQQHVNLGSNCKLIFEGNCELCTLLPEPPPPGDPLSCIRYTGYDQSKEVVEKVKRQVNLPDGLSPNRRLSSNSSIRSSRPLSSSTPVSSPNTSSSMWSPEPSAPRVPMYSPGGASGQHEPPPPYNTSYLSSSPNVRRYSSRHSTGNVPMAGTSNSPLQQSSAFQNSSRSFVSLASRNSSSVSSSQQSFSGGLISGNNENEERSCGNMNGSFSSPLGNCSGGQGRASHGMRHSYANFNPD